jgi:isocitrate/isopropylmalate dehydrogenase
VDAKFSLGLEFDQRDIGLAAHAAEGSTLPDVVVESARSADGVVLGPCDTVSYPPANEGGISPSAGIRKGFDLYANIRPSRVRTGVPAPVEAMDLVIVRENTEGFYADRNMVEGSGEFKPDHDTAFAMRKITRAGSQRIAHAAFDLSMRRNRRVTAVHKGNVLRVTDGLFMEAVREVAADYPDVTLDEVLVDAMAAALITHPERFDVIVTTNMFGDILSDEAAAVSGGLGLAAGLNAGDDHAVAQAVHGSAPDIAGQGIANPTSLILSTAMLLEWLAARHGRNDLAAAAGCVERCVDAILADPDNHTPDMGGSVSTESFGETMSAAIEAAETD